MRTAKSSPVTPPRADHRLMKKLIAINHKGKGFRPRPEDLDLCNRVFKRAGGSWERLFKGGVDDMNLLKRVLKVAAKQGRITKAPKWG